MTQQETEAKKTARWFTLLSAELVLTLLLFICSIVVFALAVNMVFVARNDRFDDAAFDFASRFVSNGFTRFMLFITFLGNHKFLIPANILLLVFYLFIRKNRKLSVRVSAIALSSLVLKLALKNSIQRLRPEIPLLEKVKGFSFPSGHALMAVTFYGLLIYICWREIKNRWWRLASICFFSVLIFLVSFSRIYLRVHYASDVLAGLALGFMWLTVTLWIIDKIEKKRFARKALAGQP